MIPRLEFHAERLVALEHARKDFLAGLNQALSPARLLGLESGHFYGQFSRTLNVLAIDKFPTLELRTIRKIGVFGQRVMFPAAGIVDGSPPP